MKRFGFCAAALAVALLAPMANAQETSLETGTWDVKYSAGGSEVKAMLSVARNSDGRLVGLWTQLPDRVNLVDVSFADGKLKFGKPVLINGELKNEAFEATLDAAKISGTMQTAAGPVAFEGTKREKYQAQRRRGGGGDDDDDEGGEGGFNVDAIFEQSDKNGDTVLSKEETPERMQQFFNVIDTNQDLALSKDEVKTAMERFQRN